MEQTVYISALMQIVKILENTQAYYVTMNVRMVEHMNKVFEKILERLEKERHTEICGGWETMRINRAKEIVQEVAEEYNNGWIACSDRLPSYDGSFICTAKGIEESLELTYSSWDNSWMDEFDSEYEVIAWQSLPEPYQSRGAMKNERFTGKDF